MIVRINQIDPAQFEGDPAWPVDGPAGRIQIQWSARAFEVLVLEQDEQHRSMPPEFCQQQLRKMIPLAAAALAESGQVTVLRLDGPATDGELLPAIAHLTDGESRYACSDFQKLHVEGPASMASLRLAATPTICGQICGDENVGLTRNVRLRAMAVPTDLVAPLLDIAATDDERWQEILPHSPYLLSTTPQLRSIRILSSKLEPADIKSRLTRQLLEVARGAVARSV